MKLGVNIDHVATVREARYRGLLHGEPDPIEAAVVSVAAGAHGITAHLREDRRHIQDRDIIAIRTAVRSRFNLEMGNTPEIIAIALAVRPDIVCLVPERRNEVTTEGGLDVAAQRATISTTCQQMRAAGIEVSLFINPDERQVGAAAETGAQFVELHTGSYAEHFQDPSARKRELERLKAASILASGLGLRVNAGHGLNYHNVTALLETVPNLEELNIGHSIISRALTVGLAEAVREMLALLR